MAHAGGILVRLLVSRAIGNCLPVEHHDIGEVARSELPTVSDPQICGGERCKLPNCFVNRSFVLLVLLLSASSAFAQSRPAQGLMGAQLFAGGSGQVPVFNDRTVGGVTAHQIVLAPGLSLAYLVSGGLVAVSSSLGGLSAVLHPSRPITSEAQYQAVLGSSPGRVGSLLFLDFSQLLSLGEGMGVTRSADFHALMPDLEAIRSVGLNSSSGEADTTAELHLQIP